MSQRTLLATSKSPPPASEHNHAEGQTTSGVHGGMHLASRSQGAASTDSGSRGGAGASGNAGDSGALERGDDGASSDTGPQLGALVLSPVHSPSTSAAASPRSVASGGDAASVGGVSMSGSFSILGLSLVLDSDSSDNDNDNTDASKGGDVPSGDRSVAGATGGGSMSGSRGNLAEEGPLDSPMARDIVSSTLSGDPEVSALAEAWHSHTSVPDAVKLLVSSHILPHAEWFRSCDAWRLSRVFTQEVDAVLRDNLIRLRELFDSYAGACVASRRGCGAAPLTVARGC